MPSEFEGSTSAALGGKFFVTDGPFTETKELIGGLALIQTKSKEEAIDWTKRFLHVAGDGETEIRQVYEADDLCHESTDGSRQAMAH